MNIRQLFFQHVAQTSFAPIAVEISKAKGTKLWDVDGKEYLDLKLAVFCTSPALRTPLSNLLTELIGTFVLVFAVFRLAAPTSSLGALDALPVGLLVLGIGVSLGGPTGYAINPARDLGPRIMHFILPMPNKRDSDWSYSWIPIVGPILGGILAAFVYKLI